MSTPSLVTIARSIGGVIRVSDGHHWLDTRIGELRAAVIRRCSPITNTITFDVVVFTPATRELSPFPPERADLWSLDDHRAVPRLEYGYVFAGCRNGVLRAMSNAPPSLERIAGALWQLAVHARKPWRPVTDVEIAAEREREQRERRARMLARVGVVAGAALVAALLRRPSPVT